MKILAINASHRGDKGLTRFFLAKDFPKTLAVCDAYEQAGRELATVGHIRPATQRRAN